MIPYYHIFLRDFQLSKGALTYHSLFVPLTLSKIDVEVDRAQATWGFSGTFGSITDVVQTGSVRLCTREAVVGR
ncbi:hypothetical protein STASHLEY_00520 [Brevundimonas phage vB_BpoS-StAshley]|nr:hypothetical protein STASHLEY_00520 [Brevundimonas phage vB_BpoS-StAshley]